MRFEKLRMRVKRVIEEAEQAASRQAPAPRLSKQRVLPPPPQQRNASEDMGNCSISKMLGTAPAPSQQHSAMAVASALPGEVCQAHASIRARTCLQRTTAMLTGGASPPPPHCLAHRLA